MTDTPFRLADMTPRKRPPWLIPLLVGLAVVVLAGGGLAAFVATRGAEAQSPTAKATSPALLSEEEACRRIRPLVDQAGQYEVDMKASKRPSNLELGRLRQAIAEVWNVAPEPIKTDIGYQRAAAVGMISNVLPDPNFKTSTIRIITRCASYPTGTSTGP